MKRYIDKERIPGLTIEYDGYLSIIIRRLLSRDGANRHPELIPGSSVGTIWVDSPDIAENKAESDKVQLVCLSQKEWME